MLCNRLDLSQAKKRFEPDDYFAIDSNIGIEVELEQCHLTLDPDLWVETYDGSLRDGREYIFNGPLNGKGLTRAINDFHIKALRAEIDEEISCNHRCSTHIHVDMTDLDNEGQLFTFILLALFMEPVLFNTFDGELRKNSIYCVPLYEQDWYLKVLNDCIRRNDIMGISNGSQKYASINLRRLVEGADEECALGTIEFRMFPSTLNGNDIRLWVNMLLSMKKYAMNHTVEDVRNLSKVLSHKGTRNFLYEIFGEEGAELLLPFAEYHKLLKGARTVERVLFDPNEEAIERLFDRKVKKVVKNNKGQELYEEGINLVAAAPIAEQLRRARFIMDGMQEAPVHPNVRDHRFELNPVPPMPVAVAMPGGRVEIVMEEAEVEIEELLEDELEEDDERPFPQLGE